MRYGDRQYWYAPDLDGEARSAAVRNLYDALRRQHAGFISDCRAWRMTYLGRELQTANWYDPKKRASQYILGHETKNLVDTLVARITRNPARPLYLTTAGDWGQRQRAKALGQFVWGVMRAADYPRKARRTFRDGMTCNIGFLKVCAPVGNETLPTLDRVMPWELLVDSLEARYGQPRSWLQYRAVDRGLLQAWFPEQAAALALEPALTTADPSYPNPDDLDLSQSDCLLVHEAWHLASGPDAGDGRHTIVCGRVTVVDEEWMRPRVPIAAVRWYDGEDGWFGAGVVEQSYAIQALIHRRMREIELAQNLIGRPVILAPAGSAVTDGELATNEIARVVHYSGPTPPTVTTPASMAGDIYDWLLQCRRQMYEEQGVTQMTASMELPASISSGEHLRLYENMQDTRHLEPAVAWEQFSLEVATLIIDEVEALAKEKGATSIVVRTGHRRTGWRRITWADVRMERDDYTVECLPVSALASSAAARQQQVDEWVQRGWIGTDEAMELLDFPDLDDARNRKLSHRRIAYQQMERILAEGEYDPPEPIQDLTVALEVAAATYLSALGEQAPDDRLELIRQYIEECLSWIEQAGMPIPPQMAQYARVAQIGGAAPMPLEGMPGGMPAEEPMPGAPDMEGAPMADMEGAPMAPGGAQA